VQVHSEKHADAVESSSITIEAPLQELLQGYLRWTGGRSAPSHQTQTLILDPSKEGFGHSPEAGVDPFLIKMPSIDLYSPSGVSLHHGTDSEKNAAFIRALPQSIPRNDNAKTAEVRPTLREATDMLTEFKAYGEQLGRGRYTLFALTYSDAPRCRAQNEAVQQLASRAHRLNIRVIEVRIRP